MLLTWGADINAFATCVHTTYSTDLRSISTGKGTTISDIWSRFHTHRLSVDRVGDTHVVSEHMGMCTGHMSACQGRLDGHRNA